MRLSIGIALCSSVLGGTIALAQPVEGPARVAPDAPMTAPAVRETTSPGAVVPGPEAPRADPNRTGPDVVNGLEVPQMKDPRDGGRP